jgi:hypothetical protein
LALAGLILTAANTASAGELITNGNFETGTFAGWSVVDQAGGSGSFFISNPGAPAPLSGLPTAPNGVGGAFYAVSDQTGPGTHALLQSITVTPGSTVTLSFDMFINNQDGPSTGSALDYTIVPTEQGRVDVLTAAAAPLSTSAVDLVDIVIGPSGPNVGNPHAYTHYIFDLTPAIGAGGTFQIRFAETDNQSNFQLGVDNVSIIESPAPEPASLSILAVAATGMLLRRRRA